MKNRDKKRILRIAYAYVMADADGNPYKLQSMVNHRYFMFRRLKMNKRTLEYYTSTFHRTHIKDCLHIRDFIFKHDYFTPRKGFLMHPRMYLYYTFQVFSLCFKLSEQMGWKNDGPVDFSLSHIKVYYSGTLFFNDSKKKVKNNFRYTSSYNKFQKYRDSYKSRRVLKIDIQDFFNNIHLESLFDHLDRLNSVGGGNISSEIYSIKKIFENSGYDSLPQVMNCMASSILSQLYLVEFTRSLDVIASEDKLDVVRYVDDMYIRLTRNFTDKRVNALKNKISSELWKNGLNLNKSKVKTYSVKEYEEMMDLPQTDSYSPNKYVGSEEVSDKAQEVLENDGEDLKLFWEEVTKLYARKGIDLDRYGKLVDKCFSINGNDANKVINSMKFNKDKNWRSFLSTGSLEWLLDRPQIVLFDPEMFVTFLVQLEDEYWKRVGHYPENTIEDFLHEIHNNLDNYSVREGLIDSKYFIQRRQFLDKSEDSIATLNREYINFISRFYGTSRYRPQKSG